ncbi:hypothetical protein MF406_00505 [Georgenia sp. TF02-10]|uniref:hypothetical protein n=1 Tax=Georgenia sp. TF02-10 TaxID=2917725 RepID=UPI001FA70636|nr:hypothetical protein [Georgenia sp. TF02-10]UNX54823.1 hypothetical protein MF406_00505 [Georgenia sp. TF02-10]
MLISRRPDVSNRARGGAAAVVAAMVLPSVRVDPARRRRAAAPTPTVIEAVLA